MESIEDQREESAPAGGRRGFLKSTVAVLCGGAAMLVAPAAGLRVFLEPWKRRPQPGTWVRVATLSTLPEDGTPRRFPVVSDQVNAWTRIPQVAIGAVFLRRTGSQSIDAFNVVCPHAGCLVDFAASSKGFLCPCHNSTFALDGKVDDPASPSPRGLDALRVEIRGQGEVWVEYQSFRTGLAKQVPA